MWWTRRAITFVNAAVVGADGAVHTTLRVRGDRVNRIGAAPAPGDTVIDLDGAVVLPGLINAHDHLELNTFPRLKWRSRYTNVRQWIDDFQPRFATDPALAAARPETLPDRLWVGALKNLFSGVTTVCHHNPLHPPLRRGYPLKLVTRFGLSHSLLIDGPRVVDAFRATPPAWPWIIHAAEGVDEEAGEEVDRLAALGCVASNTVIVHGVALSAAAAARAIERGAALVWCPTSNDFLFGRTADVRAFAACGRLAIGSDSRLSGAGDLLDEMRAAAHTGQLDAAAVVRAVTSGAASVLRLPGDAGLHPGAVADLAVFRRLAADPFASVCAASRRDVRLTMIDGRPVVADAALAAVFDGSRPATVYVDGQMRLLAPRIARRARRLTLREPGLEWPS